MVRLRQRERFHTGRKERESEEEAAGGEGRPNIQFRRAPAVRKKRIRPRSVTWMLALFIVVMLAIILLG